MYYSCKKCVKMLFKNENTYNPSELSYLNPIPQKNKKN